MLRFKQLTLLLGDLLSLYLGLYLAMALRYMETPGKNLTELIVPMSQLFLLAIIILFIAGAYNISRAKNGMAFFQRIAISAISWTGLGMMYFYIRPKTGVTPKTILLLTVLAGFGLLAFWRFLYNKYLSVALLKSNVIFAGLTTEVIELVELIKKEPQQGYFVAGIVSRNAEDKDKIKDVIIAENITTVNTQSKLPAHIIVLSPQLENNQELLKELYNSLFQQVSIISLSNFYESMIKRIPPFTFSEGWFVANLHEQQKKIYGQFKILIDYFLGALLGIFFVIAFPFVALAIKLNSRGPIFFSQKRVGRQGMMFKVFKFRTMKALTADGSAETQGPQFASDKDSRVTGVGHFLRRTRIDEIPQFINILKGQMSIIGPRPERPEFVEQLTEKMPYYALRHLIKPGLTGWAQIHNAYYGTIEENLRKLEYDLFYIKNRNFALDASIILRTIATVLKMMGR